MLNRNFLKILILLLLTASFPELTAQEVPGSEGSALSLNPTNLGSLQNSVNLHTGQVSFPMTVASLPGRGGLAAKIAIQYNSSGVKQMVNTWNREAPTGILGLGWSLHYARIICDHKQTGTRFDDTFYLVEGGQTNEMVCIDDDAYGEFGYRTYVLKSYHPWKIKYYYQSEKWEILKGDGATYVYGDKSRPRADGTIQYMIRWGNWIGDSKETEGQEEHAYIWNISEIENLWDDRLTYVYDNIEEEVGVFSDPGNPSNPRHTKASLLKKLIGPTGNYLELVYANKVYEPCPEPGDFRCTDTDREYQDPHVEKLTEPDAYQEKYDPRYLTNLRAYNENEVLLYQVQFDYDEEQWIGKGEMVKRVLTGVQQINHSGMTLPKTEFQYFKGGLSDGYLQSVSNSIGGVISYSYKTTPKVVGEKCQAVLNEWECTDVGIGNRDLKIVSPSYYSTESAFREPDVYMGPDYVVVIWRHIQRKNHTSAPRPIYVQVYTWEGEWVQQNMGGIGSSIGLSSNLQQHEIVATLQKDHFGLLMRVGPNDYKIHLFHKNVGKSGWDHFSENVLLYDGRLADAQWLTELFISSGPEHVVFSNLTSAYLYFYTWRGDRWDKERFTHTSPAGYAYTGSSNFVIAHNTRTSDANGFDHFSMHYKTEDGVWRRKPFSGGFNATGMFSDWKREKRSFWHSAPSFALAMANGNPEYIFKWDTKYDNISRETIVATGDSYPVYWRNNSFFNIFSNEEEAFDNTAARFFRYNGKTWTGKFIRSRMIKGAPDVIGLSKGSSDIIIQNYDANSENWLQLPIKTTEARFDRYIQLIPGAALMGTHIYHHEPDGKWFISGEISTLLHGGDSWLKDLHKGSSTFYSSIPYDRTAIHRIKNGNTKTYIERFNMDKRHKVYKVGDKLVGNEMFAAFHQNNSIKYRSVRFNLFKWSDDHFKGGHEAVIVSGVVVEDGHLSLKKSYDYNYETARMEPNGRFPLFNEVTEVNGSGYATNYPRGYTKYYFYNGKDRYSLPKLPSDQDSDLTQLFAGNLYRKSMYDSNDQLAFETETVYEGFIKPTTYSLQTYARPVKSISTEYLDSGKKTFVTNTSFNMYGLPIKVEKISNQNVNLASLKEVTTYEYIGSSYDFNDHYLEHEIVATQKSINDEVVASTATVWEDTQNIPRAVATYNWTGFGSSTFTNWTSGTPPAQWRMQNIITKRDKKGNILQSRDFLENHEAAVYDEKKRNPVVSASYAKYDQIAATSFESGQSGNWSFSATGINATEAYTGANSFRQAASVSGVPAGEYILYYWYKNGSCSISVTGGTVSSQEDFMDNKGWKLRKAAISLTSTGTVTLNPTGLIDEIRIYPKGAYVTTHVFDAYERKVAETGPNMRTTTFHYDDLDRQQYIADHEGNIVKYYEYGFKNYQE